MSSESIKPWVEKYRPRTIEDVAAQDHTIRVLKKQLGNANLPHMLFYGPPGTGKTSTILALSRQLFGQDLVKSRVLELNASDERGINVVREKIKNFAKQAPKASTSASVPAYKIIILDEADSMTQDAQSALRRTMETYSKSTRFCLVCNYVTRIIEPVASRCSKFRFKPLDESDSKARLEYIAQEENIPLNEGVIDTLIDNTHGDLRQAITYLQSAARLHQASNSAITIDTITEIAGTIPEDIIDNIIQVCSNKKNFKEIQSTIKQIHLFGYASAQVLLQVSEYISNIFEVNIVLKLHDKFIENTSISDTSKSKAILSIAEADKALTDGADDELQLLNLAMKLQTSLN
ncbi:P-loop containing nucleoside triphosphate hydrolase protein [Wallemia mellicola]|uniref:P-loop containing nucleoside triphosphate hydrolase protein n=1 Tax=Wallemia mellicola TaxID=1708541 RepID=A0A4T0MDP3_9BASI|nr:P-loop containing nucleoside triphosphate hydrolase protein [Wallemia mellicola]